MDLKDVFRRFFVEDVESVCGGRYRFFGLEGVLGLLVCFSFFFVFLRKGRVLCVGI